MTQMPYAASTAWMIGNWTSSGSVPPRRRVLALDATDAAALVGRHQVDAPPRAPVVVQAQTRCVAVLAMRRLMKSSSPRTAFTGVPSSARISGIPKNARKDRRRRRGRSTAGQFSPAHRAMGVGSLPLWSRTIARSCRCWRPMAACPSPIWARRPALHLGGAPAGEAAGAAGSHPRYVDG